VTVLLDTHVWLWWNMAPEKIPAPLRKLIERASVENALVLSAISPWEVAVLVEKKRLVLAMDVAVWVDQALDESGLSVHPLTPAIAVASTRLPGSFHPDPADRIVVATARELGAVLLTKDERILAYSGVKSRWGS
jgi:PIN domain nuclease of toxin-antitoxin system